MQQQLEARQMALHQEFSGKKRVNWACLWSVIKWLAKVFVERQRVTHTQHVFLSTADNLRQFPM